jgi:TPR repeat protein
MIITESCLRRVRSIALAIAAAVTAHDSVCGTPPKESDIQPIIKDRRALDYGDEKPGAENLELHFARVKTVAERGDIDAQANLAFLYSKGIGVATNKAQALFWWRKAAESGSPKAQTFLGETYDIGRCGSRSSRSRSLVRARR